MTKHCNDAKMKAQAALEAALVDLRNKEAEANAVLAAAEKQEADAEKKRANVILFEITGANGLVCRCRIPTAAVAKRGLFRILLGSGTSPVLENIQQKGGLQSSSTCLSDGNTCFEGSIGTTIDVNDIYRPDSSSSMYNNYTFTTTG